MPILVWQPTGDNEEDLGTDLTYLDGRHTLDALARNFDEVTVTVLVPQEDYRKIAELLEVSTPN